VEYTALSQLTELKFVQGHELPSAASDDFSGTKDYGNTKHGAYICEGDTAAAGMRAAKNETHP
jgi:hypothetical protein